MQSQRSPRLELERLEDRRLMSSTPGLTGQYFTGQTLQTLFTTRIDPNINFTWNNVSPVAGLGTTNYSVRWTGQIAIGQSGVYTFQTLSDDGVKVIVNGQRLIDDWTTHAPRYDSVNTWLAGGQSYNIEVDYFQNSGGAVAQLSWAALGHSMAIIPTSAFSTTAPAAAPIIKGAPTAALAVGNVTVPGGANTPFTVTYNDTVAFNGGTIGTGDVVVTGPNAYQQTAVLTSLAHTANGDSYTAVYTITPPDGKWDAAENGSYTVTLQAGQVEDSTGVWESGRVLGTFQVLLQSSDWFSTNLHNANLQNLARQLLTDGTLSRNDAIQLLDSAEASGGAVSASELQDLHTLFDGSGLPYSIPGYVKNLADKVIDGNPANSSYNGNYLTNIYAGAPSWILGELIGEWFLGTDHPATAAGLTYTYAAGSLFGSGPSYTQIVQGVVGDCYFLAAVGETALRSPAAIENMFIDNGDGTYTIRFYNNSGQADYVTVDREVPTESNGTYAYANMGEQVNNSSNVIWVALLEKAYAQLAGSGWSRGNSSNSYSAIALGWEGDVLHQIDNDSAKYNTLNGSSRNAIAAAFWAGDLVTLDTKNSTAAGIVPNHVYIVVGYNASTGAFTLYNPWGFTQTLSWTQIAQNFNAWANGNPV